MYEIRKILRQIEDRKKLGQKRLYLREPISDAARDYLEQAGYLVIVGWQYNQIVYIIGWK